MADPKLEPGRVSASDFTASMAEAMDKAFVEEWLAVKGTPLPSLGEEDRRILLVAIAQGVVAHLQQHIEAIQVEVNVTHPEVLGGAVENKAAGSAVAIHTKGLMRIFNS